MQFLGYHQCSFCFFSRTWAGLHASVSKGKIKVYGNVLGNSKPSVARINNIFGELFLSEMVPTNLTIYLEQFLEI